MPRTKTAAPDVKISPFETLRRYPAFRRLWLGSLISSVGDTLTWMALIWFVLDQGGTGGTVSGLMLSFALPALFTGSLIGHLLDKYQPRTIMVTDNLLRAVFITLIPLLYYSGRLELRMIYAITALSGALAPATQAGVRSVVPATVPKEALAEANAALAWTMQLPTILAPALAGVIIARWGALNGILLDAASFLFMAFMLSGTPNVPRGASSVSAGETTPADNSAGRGGPLILFRYPAAAVMTGIAFVFFFAYGPTETALPLFTRNTLKTDAQGYGLLWSAVGVGSILGGLAAPRLSRLRRPGLALAWIAVLWGVAQCGTAFSPTLWLASVWFFVAGIVWGPYMALENTLLQKAVPPQVYGRVFGAQAALLSPAMPLGTALGGGLLLALSPQNVILFSALFCILAGLAALFAPGLRRIGQESPPPAAE